MWSPGSKKLVHVAANRIFVTEMDAMRKMEVGEAEPAMVYREDEK